MNIALVCSEYPMHLAGGGGIVTRHMAQLLRAEGHHVRITGIYLPNELPQDYREPDFHPIIQKSGKFAWLAARRHLSRQIRRWSREKAIDIVEVPLTRGFPAFWGPLPIPVVVRIHGSRIAISTAMGQTAPLVHRFLEGRALARADAVSAVSNAILSDVSAFKQPACKTTVIHNPVRIPEFERDASSQQRIVFAGSNSEAKGIKTLAASWAQIAAQNEEAELHLYGRPEINIHERIPSGLHGRTHIHGHVTQQELHQAFATAALAVFPSQYEAFGLAAAEAMACACPVVVSSAGFGKELVSDNKTGRLISPNDPNALTQATLDLLKDPNRAQTLGTAAQQFIQSTYAPTHIVQQTVDFYTNTKNATT